MEIRLVQDENEIALAHRGSVESIGAIQADIHFLWVALELVTRQAVYLQPLRMIQAFLPRKDDKPMITRKTEGPTFPNLPLMNFHRSGFCPTLPIADSKASLSLSGP